DDSEELTRVDAALARAALNRLDAAVDELAAAGDPLSSEAIDSLRNSLSRRLAKDTPTPAASESVTEEIQLTTLLKVASSMVHAEQEELIRMRDDDGLPDAIVRPLLRELDAREQALSRKYR
ncbi:MAG: hypothetical protein K9G12_07435, partial [Candidatus Nanopelagicales bacterium]|nr:hypothetical protein [Candidatus Nanopelagicales bacterium]